MTVPPPDFELSLIIFQFRFWKDEVSSCPRATKRSACINLAARKRSLAGVRGRSPGACCRPFVLLADLLHVVAGLGIRRNLVSKLNDRSLARVVARQNQIYAVVELVQQLAQIACSARDVLRGIVRPPDTET